MSVRAVWHAGYSVSDLDRSIAFYRDALGLTLRHRQIQDNPYTAHLVGIPGARLRIAQFTFDGGSGTASGHILELIEYERPRGEWIEPANNRIGAAHLAFEVDDLDALRERLEAAGGVFLSPTQAITAGINRGGRAVYLRDPDGITLELMEPPTVAQPTPQPDGEPEPDQG